MINCTQILSIESCACAHDNQSLISHCHFTALNGLRSICGCLDYVFIHWMVQHIAFLVIYVLCEIKATACCHVNVTKSSYRCVPKKKFKRTHVFYFNKLLTTTNNLSCATTNVWIFFMHLRSAGINEYSL